ncbi:hypothetical protein BRADI_1g48318v3 [Brachypodium distachyon]|uniref:Uncharacterized protein n=1 Tax=Brachypodium distachyon TaxID=15368 RepID=A0A2K2DQA3_BRADI|nr:hypothetical protein BRADI_1g48318v3 [Brachypodium distachyon]
MAASLLPSQAQTDETLLLVRDSPTPVTVPQWIEYHLPLIAPFLPSICMHGRRASFAGSVTSKLRGFQCPLDLSGRCLPPPIEIDLSYLPLEHSL